MGLTSKFNNLFGGDEDNTEEVITKEPKINSPSGGNKMILFEPRAYSESQQIADYLKNNSSVVVKLSRVTPDQAKRIIDFVTGVVYAIGGSLQKLGGGIFLCTPKNVNVEGKIADDLEKKSAEKKEKVTKELEDTKEIDW